MSVATTLADTVAQINVASIATSVYTSALLASLAILASALLGFALRGQRAEARALVWRAAVAALLIIFVGRQIPLHWVAWVMPSTLAAPLVAIGRAQMVDTVARGSSMWAMSFPALSLVAVALAIYAIGVFSVLIPTLVTSLRLERRASTKSPANERWTPILDEIRSTLGISRAVQVLVDDDATVPVTWGWLRPVVVVPQAAHTWTDEQLRIVLFHELAHVRAADWAFGIAARVMCAVYWFHPGAWWLAKALRADSELACDDRVIASGVRRSDYAELLVSAANALLVDPAPPVFALSQRGGLRSRLAAVLDARRDVRPLECGWRVVAVAVTFAFVGPMSAVQLAPSREVLTTLMQDARWESRAYAVLGLAQRPDSIAVARSAAERDPSPRVRAWARYALGEQAERPDLRAIIHD